MNLEEIREAARERDYEDEPATPFEPPTEPPSTLPDLRGLAASMAPKLEALANQFEIASEKFAAFVDILDKAWGEITAISEGAVGVGLRGEGASLLLDGVIKVVDGSDELNWDDSVDAFAGAFAHVKDMLGTPFSGLGGIHAEVSGAAEMERKIREMSAISGESVESIKDGLSKLASTSVEPLGSLMDRARSKMLSAAPFAEETSLVSRLYGVDGVLVSVSERLEQMLVPGGGIGYRLHFHAPNNYQSDLVRETTKKGVQMQLRIEDEMGTPYVTWSVPAEQAQKYATSPFPFHFDFDTRFS